MRRARGWARSAGRSASRRIPPAPAAEAAVPRRRVAAQVEARRRRRARAAAPPERASPWSPRCWRWRVWCAGGPTAETSVVVVVVVVAPGLVVVLRLAALHPHHDLHQHQDVLAVLAADASVAI